MPEPTDFGYGHFRFSWGDHICAIFDDHAQQMTIMSSFIAAGLQAGQRCLWVSPRESADALRVALTEIGGDLATLEASGQLLIISEVEFYLQDGIFEPERTLDLLGTLLQDNQREGYATMRVASDVSWLREGRPDPELWESFEARLTWEVAGLPLVMVAGGAAGYSRLPARPAATADCGGSARLSISVRCITSTGTPNFSAP